MRAFDATWLTRPVSSAYRCCAEVNCAADAPGKFVALNIAIAGSELTTSKLAVGTSIWFFAHNVYCVTEAPIVKLCAPLSQVTLSSMRCAVAFRDEGVAALPGEVRLAPTLGKDMLMPFML